MPFPEIFEYNAVYKYLEPGYYRVEYREQLHMSYKRHLLEYLLSRKNLIEMMTLFPYTIYKYNIDHDLSRAIFWLVRPQLCEIPDAVTDKFRKQKSKKRLTRREPYDLQIGVPSLHGITEILRHKSRDGNNFPPLQF